MSKEFSDGIQYTPEEIVTAMLEAGFTPDTLTTGLAVALAENNGNDSQSKIPTDGPNGRENSWGVWQIYLNVHPLTVEQARDLNISTVFAYNLSGHGYNWTPWSAFKVGTYREYLEAAAYAVNNVLTNTGDEKAPITYVVEAGDTLSSIAVKYFGDASRWREIIKASGYPDDFVPETLQVGAVLTIPPFAPVEPTPVEPTPIETNIPEYFPTPELTDDEKEIESIIVTLRELLKGLNPAQRSMIVGMLSNVTRGR